MDKKEPLVDARDVFFFAGLGLLAGGAFLAFGLPVALIVSGSVLLYQAMKG